MTRWHGLFVGVDRFPFRIAAIPSPILRERTSLLACRPLTYPEFYFHYYRRKHCLRRRMCLLCCSVLPKRIGLFDFGQGRTHMDDSKRLDCPRFWHTWATVSVSTHHAGCMSLGRLVPPSVAGKQTRPFAGDGHQEQEGEIRHETGGSVFRALDGSVRMGSVRFSV